jgi:hypothetical protein
MSTASAAYISSFNSTYVSKTSVALSWSGTYDTVNLTMTSDRINYTTLLSNSAASSYTVSDLTIGKRYYFTITPNKKTNLIYSKSENGLSNTYLSINGSLFDNVYGIVSNSGYGYTVPNNAIYLQSGDKVSVVTPKSYPYTMAGDVEIEVDLNTYVASF